jgi:pyruvate,orthophosphate dikinase
MPGMMDSVLNLGGTPETIEGLIHATSDARFGYDSYRRLIQMFGNVVLGIDHDEFEEALERLKRTRSLGADAELVPDDLRALIRQYRNVVLRRSGREFPDDPLTQLEMAIRAVFESWNNPRATAYRTHHKIPHDLGTAVNIQAMVFGNMGPDSGSGVAFTRNPATGERAVYGEYLLNAQGEDLVAGLYTPNPLPGLERDLPRVYQELRETLDLLERHYRDVQDVEFTIERGRLYLLQTRTGQRSARAAVKIAVDMTHEGLITKEEALRRVDAGSRTDPAPPGGSGHAQDGAGAWAGRQPRCRPRRRRLRCRVGGRPGAPGRAGDPGAHADRPERSARNSGGPGRPNRAGRHHQPRRHRGPGNRHPGGGRRGHAAHR